VYRAQRRGGKGLKGATTEQEDPIEHLFMASTHAYLLFFTNKGKVYWQKVYELPELSRESRGRAIVNLLNLARDEKITDCLAVRDFNLPGHFLMKATRKGLVKKTPLEAYSRPNRGGIIAVKLRDDDELVDVVVTKPGDEVLLATATGMAIRFAESDVRPMGRNTSGVKGISLQPDDELVGMVVADPEATLLTACRRGYGKRTPFGVGSSAEEELDEENASAARYRTQRRGGKGLRDIKTTGRNGRVIGITRVTNDDEILMMTARGKIQRVAVQEISVIGRNTQGVRIMTLDAGDVLAAIVRVRREDKGEEVLADTGSDVSARLLEPPTESSLETSDDDLDQPEDDSDLLS
jgi:DNA gyrase subunit A